MQLCCGWKTGVMQLGQRGGSPGQGLQELPPRSHHAAPAPVLEPLSTRLWFCLRLLLLLLAFIFRFGFLWNRKEEEKRRDCSSGPGPSPIHGVQTLHPPSGVRQDPLPNLGDPKALFRSPNSSMWGSECCQHGQRDTNALSPSFHGQILNSGRCSANVGACLRYPSFSLSKDWGYWSTTMAVSVATAMPGSPWGCHPCVDAP